MKWQPFMCMFVLNKMCELISSGVRTDKGFKEVHLNTVAKQVFEFCGQEVSATQHIFSFRMATGKHAMGLGEPLGSSMPDFPGTLDVKFLDGPNKPAAKPFDKPFDPNHDRKRKRGGLMEEDINDFCSMTEAVKGVATTIGKCKPLDVHPDLYGAVMTQGGFSDEALMAALSHLLDNKAQGVGFVAMADAHRGKWYVVFIDEVPGVYSSWQEANAQVASYSNCNYRGFKTRQAAEQAYSAWV
ncbi:unnamed protein product [Triticum turgidum subsp. durum]|uniref:Ribonuclease H1 N-terminal domain-containing protein n=1 Tax=Triticum turgidum subsp. durum TaxID=4567 RepID=A0A9R1BD61_TRITD|nr:unnamed protein product [Triticum turgidum subsp. durum]